MQQVLNAQERNNAFFKFLLFFIVTVALVVTAVYFDFRVPKEQNKKLLETTNTQSAINDKEEKFVAKASAVSGLLDSLYKPGTSKEILTSRISDEVAELYKEQSSDNPLYDKLNRTLLEKFQALVDQSKIVQAKEKEIANLKSTNDLLDQQNNNLKSNQPAGQAFPNR